MIEVNLEHMDFVHRDFVTRNSEKIMGATADLTLDKLKNINNETIASPPKIKVFNDIVNLSS